MTEKLLPCPFCGGEADPDIADTGVFWVRCKTCAAEGSCEDTEAAAIEVWNTRAPQAAAHAPEALGCGDPACKDQSCTYAFEPTAEQINAAAECMWNDRDARMGGSWSSREQDEIVTIQTKATARAALIAANRLAAPPVRSAAISDGPVAWLLSAEAMNVLLTLQQIGNANNANVQAAATLIIGMLKPAAPTTSPEPRKLTPDEARRLKQAVVNSSALSYEIEPELAAELNASPDRDEAKEGLQAVLRIMQSAFNSGGSRLMSIWDTDLAKVEKALAALSAPVAGAWQDISTAPKNGDPINIYVPIHQPDRRVLSAYWTDAGWWICSGSIVAGKPTLWQPLPAEPFSRHQRGSETR